MENEKGIVKLTRQQIYDDIWKMSVAGVARKYNLHYAHLIESCKEADIPFPTSGYWTRKNCGKDVSSEVVSLSGDGSILVDLTTNDSVVKRIKKRKAEEKTSVKEDFVAPENEAESEKKPKDNEIVVVSETRGILEFLEENEREKVLNVACSLEINENTSLHKALVQYKKRISEYNVKLKNAQSQRYYNPRYNKPENEPDFFKEVSEDSIKRVMAILDSLFKAVEKLGGSINDDLSIQIKNDSVRIRVAESKDKVKHEITKQEAQELLKYEDEKKRYRWASMPKIRQYDQVYNGRIRIVFDEKKYIRDSEKEKLEDRLGDILISLYGKAEENRVARELREEAERKRAEEERRREELRKRKEDEITRTKELTNKAEDYRIASEIRAYINAMIENGNEKATSEWIEWASKKADWYDPTLDVENEYLGRREHGKNKEEKDLDKVNVRKNYYW
jgi:hypothetical protein